MRSLGVAVIMMPPHSCVLRYGQGDTYLFKDVPLYHQTTHGGHSEAQPHVPVVSGDSTLFG